MLYLFDGLICTDVEVYFEGKKKLLKNVVIDTGAVQSILNHSFVLDIDINPKYVDEFRMTYGIGGEMDYLSRKIDKIEISEFEFTDLEIDFGLFKSFFLSAVRILASSSSITKGLVT